MNRVCLFIFGMLLASPLWAAGEVKDIPTRPGVTQRLLLLKPERPLAVLLVFTGGEQPLNIRKDGSLSWGRRNLLLRTSPLFVLRGFAVAIIDTPSDQKEKPVNNFRERGEHAQDIAAAIAFLRKDTQLPVWLIGTGSGTTSVLNAAIRLQRNGADGIVLTSGLADDSGSPFQARLGEIHVPTLSVRKTDPCIPSPQRESDDIMALFKNAPKADEIAVQPVVAADSDPCKAPPTHGYLGLEDQFTDKISGWIKSMLRRQKFI